MVVGGIGNAVRVRTPNRFTAIGCSKGIHVIPVVGKQRDRVGGNRGSNVGVTEPIAAGVRVVITLNVNGVFRGNRQAAIVATGASADGGQKIRVDDFDSAAEEEWGVFPGSICGIRNLHWPDTIAAAPGSRIRRNGGAVVVGKEGGARKAGEYAVLAGVRG